MQDNTSSSSSIKLFEYEGAEVRTIVIDEEVWFVAKDVCNILGLTNHRDAVTALDDDERRVSEIATPSNGGHSSVNLINEAGVYRLTFKSHKPEAKKFTRWVTHEVLPQVMRTGKYRYTASVAGKAPLELDAQGMCKIAADLSILRSRESYWEAIEHGLEKFWGILPDEKAKDEGYVRNYAIYDIEDLRILDALANVAQMVIKNKLNVLREKANLLETISISQL